LPAGLQSLAPKNLDFQGRDANFPGKDFTLADYPETKPWPPSPCFLYQNPKLRGFLGIGTWIAAVQQGAY
jgi:hypothetical protein